MVTIPLAEFITVNRAEVVRRCRAKVAERPEPPVSDEEIEAGVPLFLDQLASELLHGQSKTHEISKGAHDRGKDLFFRGLTVSQVVHDYGAICQSITGLAVDMKAPISPEDFRTLNRCLDDAIAGAVSEYERQQLATSDGHDLELKNLVVTAFTAFEIIRAGSVGVGGTTGDLVLRSLTAMRLLV
jgi:hypothetical protein